MIFKIAIFNTETYFSTIFNQKQIIFTINLKKLTYTININQQKKTATNNTKNTAKSHI